MIRIPTSGRSTRLYWLTLGLAALAAASDAASAGVHVAVGIGLPVAVPPAVVVAPAVVSAPVVVKLPSPVFVTRPVIAAAYPRVAYFGSPAYAYPRVVVGWRPGYFLYGSGSYGPGFPRAGVRRGYDWHR